MKERLKVKIKQGRAWYQNMVGEIVEVVEWGKHYVMADDYETGFRLLLWRHIDFSDAENINELTEPGN